MSQEDVEHMRRGVEHFRRTGPTGPSGRPCRAQGRPNLRVVTRVRAWCLESCFRVLVRSPRRLALRLEPARVGLTELRASDNWRFHKTNK
jgi:hypothetical protein